MIGAILQGLSLAGGLAGALRKPKTPDLEYMRQHFGEGAAAQRAGTLAQQILASDYGRSLMAGAAEQGQQFQTSMNQRAAASGFGANEGAESGASTFATGAAQGAASSLMGQVRANTFRDALTTAQQQLQGEREQYLQNLQAQNERPNALQRIGAVAGQVASMFPSKPKETTDTTDDTKGAGGFGFMKWFKKKGDTFGGYMNPNVGRGMPHRTE